MPGHRILLDVSREMDAATLQQSAFQLIDDPSAGVQQFSYMEPKTADGFVRDVEQFGIAQHPLVAQIQMAALQARSTLNETLGPIRQAKEVVIFVDSLGGSSTCEAIYSLAMQ